MLFRKKQDVISHSIKPIIKLWARLCSYPVPSLSVFIVYQSALPGWVAERRRAHRKPLHLLPSPLLLASMCTCNTGLHCIMGAAEAMPKPNLERVQHFIGK